MSNKISLISTKAAPIAWVESLFERMQALYGNKFLDMWRETNLDLVKKLWAEEMGKLSDEELRRGYSNLMKRDWPPSLPEYVKMCKPSIDPTIAYYEALNGMKAREKGEVGEWSHPAIYWAAIDVSYFDLNNQGYSQLKARWEKALQDQLDKREWSSIPEPMVALPAPGKTELSRDEANKRVAELKADSVVKQASAKIDHKLWAKRIMEKSKLKNHGLSALQIRFAKEALADKRQA